MLGSLAAGIAAMQPLMLWLLGEANVSSLAALSADPAGSRRMFVVLFAFMPAMFLAYWIAAQVARSIMPVTATFVIFAVSLWFALELLPRSFDLWVVQGRWLPSFAAADPVGREALEQKYAFYRDAVFSLAFVRRHALLVAQACLALVAWRTGIVGKLLALALGASVLRLLLGTFATYGGLGGLHAVADPMYFFTAATVFPLLATWLWRQSRTLSGSRTAPSSG